MNSLEIRQEKVKLIEMVNSIPLPLEVKKMILREVMIELESALEQEIRVLLANQNSKNTDTEQE